MARKVDLILPAAHPALHLWIESEAVDVGTDPGRFGWSVDYLYVSLTDEILIWADENLTARPRVRPGRYPNEAFPDAATILQPLYAIVILAGYSGLQAGGDCEPHVMRA